MQLLDGTIHHNLGTPQMKEISLFPALSVEEEKFIVNIILDKLKFIE